MSDAEVGVIGTLAGVVIGFGLTELKHWLERGRRAKGHFGLLRVEVEDCADRAAAYVQANIAAPLYRLPADAYHHAVPVLMADGKITSEELRALRRFYGTVDELNRGLDYVQEIARQGADNAQVGAQLKRNVLKARRLTRPDGEHYKLANDVLAARAV